MKVRVITYYSLLCIFITIILVFIRLHSLLLEIDNTTNSNNHNNPKAALQANVNLHIQPKTVRLQEDLSFARNAVSSNKFPDFQTYIENAPDCRTHLKDSDIDFTLVTQFSDDRLWMMKEHCNRWKGAMSVVVFSNDTVDIIVSKLLEFGCPVEEGDLNSKKFSLQIVSKNGYSDDDYPVNILRNIALSMVKTSHMLYVDVDFWPGEETYDALMHGNVRSWLASDPLLAIVVPAFQINRQCREYRDCRGPNLKKIPKSLEDIFGLWNGQHRQVFMFDPTNKGGHGSTDYKKWFEMKSGSLADLDCTQSNRYEPYVAVRYCDEFPPYQELFSGYGKNKVTHAMQMRRSGYYYSQVGGGFLVHYPHLDSDSRVKWNFVDGNGHREKSKRAQVDKLFVKFKAWLIDTLPDMTRLSAIPCENFQNDDHKLWLD